MSSGKLTLTDTKRNDGPIAVQSARGMEAIESGWVSLSDTCGIVQG